MTTPGSAGLGTAYGKVRIDYESTGVGRAAKDVENLQASLVRADKDLASFTKESAQATAQVSQFAAQTAKVSKNIKNPAAGLGDSVSKEVTKASKSVADLLKQLDKGVKVGSSITVVPEKVKIDGGSFQKAIDTWKKTTQQQISVDTGLTVKLNFEADMDRVKKLAENVRDNFAEVVSDQYSAGEKAGEAYAKGFGSKAKGNAQQQNSSGGGFGAGAIGAAGFAAKAVGGATLAGAAAGGFVLKSGFDRLNSLDTAAAKLKAMKFDTQQIQAISKNAAEAVDGTAFSLDQAFNAAATAIAAGIKPGQELTNYLKLVADNAALAGTSMADMGDLFNQVAVDGKLTGDVVNSLQARGVDVFGNLAKSLNITTAAASKLTTDGGVDFAKFREAMNLNAGAAVTMGQTVTGSWDNMIASIRRLGANVLKPIFGNADGTISPVANAIQMLTGKLKELEKWFKNNPGKIISFWENAGKAGIQFGQVIITVVGGVIESLGQLIKGISHVPSVLAGIVDALGGDGSALRDAGQTAKDFGQSVFDAGQAVFDSRKYLNQGWKSLSDWADNARKSANSTADLGNSIQAVTGPAETLGSALEKYGVKEDGFNKGIEGTTEQFKELLKTLKDKGAPQSLLDYVQKIRDGFEGGGRQVKGLQQALDKLKDSTASASDKADTLIEALQKLGVLPDDGLDEWNQKFLELTDASQTFASTIDATGKALVNLDGTINSSSFNGSDLASRIQEFQKLAYTPVQGVSPADVYDKAASGLQAVLNQYGITGDDAQKVIERYLQPKDSFLKTMAGDTKGVLEDAFGKDPAKLQAALDITTKEDDILKQVLPDGVLSIPATIDVKDKAGQSWWAGVPGIDPNAKKPEPAPSNAKPTTEFGGGGGDFNSAGPPDAPSVKQGLLQHIWDMIFNPETTGVGAGSVQTSFAPDVFGTTDQVKKTLADNPALNDVLGPMIANAEQQGINYAEAFAKGINEGNEQVKQAVIELARLSEGLGNSPAPWGPLSGKGWTKERGKVFVKGFADGITSETQTAKSAVESMTMRAAMPFGDSLTSVLKDAQEFSDLGKRFTDVFKQISDITFGTLGLANQLSGGRLFPKSYIPDPTAKAKGSLVPGGGINPENTIGPNIFGSSAVTPRAPQNLKGGDAVAQEFINQATAAGWNKEQILAGLGTLNQETGFGTNPNTNKRQNQNGTPGIQGVFQQDDSYLKYGDKTDPANAIRGFIDQFMKRGAGLDNPNPWQQALAVQVPANVGAGGYNDGTGDYLKNQQRATALDVYNRLAGQGGSPSVSDILPSVNNGYGAPDYPKDLTAQAKWWSQHPDLLAKSANPQAASPAAQSSTVPTVAGTNQAISILAQIAKDRFGLTLTSGKRDNAMTASGKSYHLSGEAGDFSNGSGNTPEQAAFAKYLNNNFSQYLAELIYSDPNAPGVSLNNGNPFDYGASTNAEHRNHVHVAIQDSMQSAFEAALAGNPIDPGPFGKQPSAGVNSAGQPVPVTLPNNVTQGLLSMPEGIKNLETGLGPVTNQQDAVSRLQQYDSLINDANMRGDKATADYIGKQKSSLLSSSGLQEAPNALDQASQLASGATGIASSAFAVVDSVINSIGAAKNIGDTLVRGFENTGDVSKVIDDFQNFLDLGSKIAQLTSDITGFASQMVGAGAAGDPSGGAAGASMALGAVSTISGLVGQGFAAANAVIDLGQEITKMAGKYVGRAITSALGFPGATDMKFLLDTVTGQLTAYTSDNPDMKHTFNTFGGDKSGAGRQAPSNAFYIYQGPGQDPRDTMTSAMFAVKSSGVGAFGYAD